MTRIKIRLRAFWYVTCWIYYFKWLHWRPRLKKAWLAMLLFLILLLGLGLGYAWRMAQVDPAHEREISARDQTIERLEFRILDLRDELGRKEANRAITRNRGRK